MRTSREEFITYAPIRDVVFVLGAGASYAEGVPLQRDILPFILNGGDQEIEESEIGQMVVQFIKDNFDFDPSNNLYPSLEAIFGYLDYFIQAKESLGDGYTTVKLQQVRESLIMLIHYTINKNTKKGTGAYRALWDAIRKFNRNISIVTMNHDDLLDGAFDFLYPEYGYIDYCIHFMNYDHMDKIEPFFWWINPREPVRIWDDSDPIPIKLIKLHGSLNWKYCNCCNQILLTPWDTDVDLKTGGFLRWKYGGDCAEGGENVVGRAYEYICPLDGTKFQTLIVPPTHTKQLTHPIITNLIQEAAYEVRKCKKIVFIGYSFPEADIHIKALFKKNIPNNVELLVINIHTDAYLKSAYKSICDKVAFIEEPFEDVATDDSLMKSILSP